MPPSLSVKNGSPADVQPGAAGAARPLPLQAAVEAHEGGWSVRLPVRAEYVNITKEAVFLEEVRIWRARTEATQTVSVPQRSERLVVDDGDAGR